ncbi:hypothetical protein BCR34DRAFT_654858, partial [Clohesyomyces aquaticus]
VWCVSTLCCLYCLTSLPHICTILLNITKFKPRPLLLNYPYQFFFCFRKPSLYTMFKQPSHVFNRIKVRRVSRHHSSRMALS